MRNLREMMTLCHVLEHLAMGRIAEASDMVIQTLKAVEKAAEHGNWDRAKLQELLIDEKVLYHFAVFFSPLFLSQHVCGVRWSPV